METSCIPSAHMLVNFPDANTGNAGSKQEAGSSASSGGWGRVTQVEFRFLFPPVSERRWRWRETTRAGELPSNELAKTRLATLKGVQYANKTLWLQSPRELTKGSWAPCCAEGPLLCRARQLKLGGVGSEE